jgi:hypothetical protein
MRALVIPPAAQRDKKAVQMLSAWIAENGLHCTLNIGMWQKQGVNEARAWGMLLADVIRHVANAIEEKHGFDAYGVSTDIVEALLEEIEDPTSDAKGEFSPGHS